MCPNEYCICHNTLFNNMFHFLNSLQAAMRKFKPLFDRILVEKLLPELVNIKPCIVLVVSAEFADASLGTTNEAFAK